MPSIPAAVPARRIELRRWSLEHLDAVMEAIEASIESLKPWMPWAAAGVPSRETELSVFETGITDFDRDHDWQFSTFEIDTDAVVGGCGLHRTDHVDRLEIGYWTHAIRRGRGYATEAANALTDAAFTNLGWVNEIQIRMDTANTASARVPAKLGYQLIGEEARPRLAPGHTGRGFVWSLDRSTWRSENPGRRDGIVGRAMWERWS